MKSKSIELAHTRLFGLLLACAACGGQSGSSGGFGFGDPGDESSAPGTGPGAGAGGSQIGGTGGSQLTGVGGSQLGGAGGIGGGAGVSAGSGGSAPSPYAGSWVGKTSTGNDIGFTVSTDGYIDSLITYLDLDLVSETCTGPAAPGLGRYPITGNHFSVDIAFPVSSVTSTVDGDFSADAASASGTYSGYSGGFFVACGSTFTTGTGTPLDAGTWHAQRGTLACKFTNDGVCDEPQGDYACLNGTDTADCGGGAGGSAGVGGSAGNGGAGSGGDGVGGTGGAGGEASSIAHTNNCGSGCSCAGMSSGCQGESCCTSAPVTGCSDCAFPVGSTSTIGDFTLDKYEVTVGRFRAFVSAYQGPPPAGAGDHPLVPGSGWQSAWDSSMPPSSAALAATLNCSTGYSTWLGGDDALPMNCVNWYTAFAFCAWDGGRLPTEAEWQYAAAGGAENRAYPWGASAPDSTDGVFGFCTTGTSCNCCSLADLEPVGSKPAGAGKWGHLDLAGSVHEWTLDWYADTYPAQSPCSNCSNLTASGSSDRVFRGGGWFSDGSELSNTHRNGYRPEFAAQDYGFRCARSP